MWKKVSSQLPEVESDSGFLKLFINWIIGVILVYSILFGTGKLLLTDYTGFIIYILIAVISIVILYLNISKIGWKKLAE